MGILSWLLSKRNYKAPETPKAPTKITLVEPEGVGLILKRHYEGCEKKLSNGLIAPYLDIAGVPTIGWGNTYYEDGRKVRMSDAPITQARADALGQAIWDTFKARVSALLPLHAPERDAEVFTSFAYNIGIGGFTASSTLQHYLAGNREAAGAALENWVRANGVVVKGLQRRRRAEHLVFDGMDPQAAIKQAAKDFP